MKYPKYAKVDGVRYPINTSFTVALKCFDVVNDETISDTERSLAIIYMLFGFIPPEKNIDKFLDIAVKYLQCGESKETQETKKKDMDFNYDMKYIVSSFMSDYHIDLTETDMHFFQFIDLIQGLTEKCSLNRVREIRNYNLNEIKDPKLRAQMARAQESFALPVQHTQEEQDALDEFEMLLSGGGG